jgi:hypothetical protein
MFKAFDRLRARRVSSAPRPETTTLLQKASVEEIWRSWRYEKPAPQPTSTTQSTSVSRPNLANVAERVNQLERLGEHDEALQITLSKVEREEHDGARRAGGHPMVPWDYWEAAAI